jgi:hypothetical protein
MKTAFDIACDAYLLRKQAAHRARLLTLQDEMVRLPLAPGLLPTPARRGRA